MTNSTRFLRILFIALVMCVLSPVGDSVYSAGTISAASQNSKGKSGRKSSSKGYSGKNAGKKTTSGTKKSGKSATGSGSKSSKSRSAAKSKSGRSNSGSKKRVETSEDVKKRQAATDREIVRTREEIAKNERAVRAGVNKLGSLQTDIESSKKQVDLAEAEVNALDARIAALEKEISGNQREIEKLREEYLKAVKKMRGKRANNSDLAFIFSSKSFNQALRRMRYLRQFSQWKDKKAAEISRKVDELHRQSELLSQTQADKRAVYNRQLAMQRTLQKQYGEQDALVVELKKNGSALRTHLQNKQAEANALKGRIASLIAAEQQKAEAERRKQEAARAEAERKAREAEAARANEKVSAQGNDLVADNTPKKGGEKNEPAKETAKKDVKKQEKKGDSKKDYASARKRKPRGKSEATPAQDKTAKAKSANTASGGYTPGGSFEKMRGSLPRPVNGGFKVTSRFGRHSLPDLPEVMYDNPGIDAEVASGASALAVYSGKVSGVYMIPGFSTVVIVNHGSYYTVYGNIASPSVKVGDTVEQGHTLGSIANDEDNPGHGSIHFEVWHNREKLNPLDWIKN